MAKVRVSTLTPPKDAFHAPTRAAWPAWLAQNHSRTNGVWLVYHKKNTNLPLLAYDDAVEEALCFGWIDSKPRSLDTHRAMLWFAPRNPRSAWSKRNKERVKKLIDAKLMTPAGLAKITAAQKSGAWSALDAVEQLVIPDDLAAAFEKLPPAASCFNAFPRSVKRNILEWISTAKRPETRQQRIAETARRAQKNERANQWRDQQSK